MYPFSMFQKRDTLNPPTIDRSPTPERKKRSSKRETKDKQKEKREKRKRSRSPKRRKRSRSRSPHRHEKSPESSRTRRDRRKDKVYKFTVDCYFCFFTLVIFLQADLQRKLEVDNFKVTVDNNQDDILLDLAVDSKESVKLREKLERKKEKLLKRKAEHEQKQREKSEKRSISHIIGKKRRSDESPGPSSSKKFGFSNDLDEVKSRLLDKDQPRIKSTINVDSDAESEITLAPSMVLNEGNQIDKRYFFCMIL